MFFFEPEESPFGYISSFLKINSNICLEDILTNERQNLDFQSLEQLFLLLYVTMSKDFFSEIGRKCLKLA